MIWAAVIFACSFCQAQSARIVNLEELQRVIADNEASVRIVNFWATWCAPCVKELPYFEKVHAAGLPGVKVTLVSMDLDLDPNPEKIYKFIERKRLRSEILLLDERNPDSYIDRIDKNWSGALPATLMVNYKTGKRIFIERSLREGELEQLLNDIQ